MSVLPPVIEQLDRLIQKYESVSDSYIHNDPCHAKSYFACLITAAIGELFSKRRLGCSLNEAFEYIAAHTLFCHRKYLEAALKITGEPAERMQAVREFCCDDPL
ncbi:hypothetical protein AGMMS50229_15620 [Campylobacterota bacterium]|nr:hypothetical protein AGMMS50229_15620 [Campylobacterota bacterium]